MGTTLSSPGIDLPGPESSAGRAWWWVMVSGGKASLVPGGRSG